MYIVCLLLPIIDLTRVVFTYQDKIMLPSDVPYQTVTVDKSCNPDQVIYVKNLMAVAQNLANSILIQNWTLEKPWTGFIYLVTIDKCERNCSFFSIRAWAMSDQRARIKRFYQLQIDLCGFIYDDKTFYNDRKYKFNFQVMRVRSPL